jgi:hypothetical protein
MGAEMQHSMEPGQRRMQPRQLRGLIETGHYALEPSLIADAMLQRRGVRVLLGDSPSWRSRPRVPHAS